MKLFALLFSFTMLSFNSSAQFSDKKDIISFLQTPLEEVTLPLKPLTLQTPDWTLFLTNKVKFYTDGAVSIFNVNAQRMGVSADSSGKILAVHFILETDKLSADDLAKHLGKYREGNRFSTGDTPSQTSSWIWETTDLKAYYSYISFLLKPYCLLTFSTFPREAYSTFGASKNE